MEEEKQEEGKGKLEQEEKEVPWISLAVSNYQKSTVWFVVALAMCALRSANAFTVFLAYF